MVDQWRNDPVLFVREALGAEPTAQQQEALRALAKAGSRVAIRSGHGTGKSTMMAWTILWGLTCFWDVKIPVTAPTAHQLKDVIWNEVRKWGRELPSLWKNSLKITESEISYEGCPGIAVARTGRKDNPEALQGFHSDHLIFLIDEASGIDDVVFDVAKGALSTENARVLMCANPTRNSGYFYNAFHRARDLWTRFQFSCLDSPRVSPLYAQDIIREYGEDSDMYRVRVLGDFPISGDMQFISRKLAEEASQRHLTPQEYNFAPIILGVDVARGNGGDRSVIFMRQGLYSKILWWKRDQNLMILTNTVAQFKSELNADAIMVDGGGIGAGVIDRLREMGFYVFDVQFGSSSSLANCANKRTEIWWKMREWLQNGGVIQPEEDLIDDLVGPECTYNVKDELLLERKEDMKKRGLSSPDLADALAITFAVPVASRNPYSLKELGTGIDNFDPLKF